MKDLEPDREDMVRAREEALKGVVTRIETVDEDGQIHVEVIPGISNGRSGYSATDCLITTNARSTRKRVTALTFAIAKADKVIHALKYGQGEAPSDPLAYLQELWESIPSAGAEQ